MTLPPQDRNEHPDIERDGRNDECPESEDDCHTKSQSSNLKETNPTHDGEMDIFAFHVGQLIDVLDSVNRWSEAEVLKIDRQNNRIFVSFLYWQSKWDTWVDNIIEQTAPLHAHTYVHPGPLRLGQRINVQDPCGTWLEAFVTEETRDQVKVHYRNFAPTFDEYIPRRDTHRFRQYGPDKNLKKKIKQWRVPTRVREDDEVGMLIAHKEARANEHIYDRPGSASNSEHKRPGSKGSSRGSEKKQHTSSVQDQERQRQITEFSERYLHYTQALDEQGLEVHPVEGDGNCLFRSVAHQVYGDERLHAMVREKCMDYMESQADFYCQFVVGGMETFPLYVAAKRQSGCWGDDPEIQAMCEMYGRPAYIWAYDAQRGAKNLRTFHEAAEVHGRTGGQSCGLIRLSYYGGGHYDSIHKFGTFDNRIRSQNQEKASISSSSADDNCPFIRSRPGVLEESAIRRVSQRQREENSRQSGQSPRLQSSVSGGNTHTNTILEQELAQVAEAKRVSEQEASDMDLDLAIRASRHGITYWTEDDVESCLIQSMAMNTAEEKSSSLSAGSRPSSKNSSRKQYSDEAGGAQHSSSSIGVSPRPEAPKRQKMDESQRDEDSALVKSPRSESKVSSQLESESMSAKQVASENEVLSESLRVHEEEQLRAASIMSEKALMEQALKV